MYPSCSTILAYYDLSEDTASNGPRALAQVDGSRAYGVHLGPHLTLRVLCHPPCDALLLIVRVHRATAKPVAMSTDFA